MAYYKAPDFTAEIDGERIIWQQEGEIVFVEPYGLNAIRVRASRSLRIDETLNWTLLPPSTKPLTEISTSKQKGVLKNGDISCEITGDGTITFLRSDGSVLLHESWIDGRVNNAPLRRAREFKVLAGDVFALEQYFDAYADEHFYGMGQDPNDCFDLKGTTLELAQKNTKCSIPFAYSSRGYGLLWNNPSVGKTEFSHNHTSWHANAAAQIDYIIMVGQSPAKILEKYTEFTGRAQMLPDWAMGLWQSKLRYETQQEVLDVVHEYHRRKLPLSVIVIDYFHWTQQGEWKFDKSQWPDPKAMVEEIEKMGTKVMVSIWPTVDTRSENYEEMKNRNYLMKTERGVNVLILFYGAETCYDATHPGARKFLWEKIENNYASYGIKNYWLDQAEPEMRPYDFDNVRYYLGNGMQVSNIYPFYHSKAFYDGAISMGETEVVNLVRCAWHGSQRLGSVVWSGDVASSFDSLRKQMKAGLNIALCGIPWWTTDIGGFVNGDPEDPVFRELLVRWFQYGAFCPIFRLHGYRLPYIGRELSNPNGLCYSGGPNEVWSFGQEAYEILAKFIGIREKMLPYIREQMKAASQNGSPVMRPLFFDFPNDQNLYSIGDSYMFGPNILVAPIITFGARSRQVYLPKGPQWTELATGKVYDGGQTVDASAPLDTLPLFFKDNFSLSL